MLFYSLIYGCNCIWIVCVYIYIIIIMSRRLRGYPWPSLAISPYQSSPPAGLQGYIPCPHIAAVCKFVLVVPLLHIHVWGSTGVHRLWARPCFSSSVPRVWSDERERVGCLAMVLETRIQSQVKSYQRLKKCIIR